VNLIPLGGFNATVSYLGVSTAFSGNASTQPITHLRLLLSYPDTGLFAGVTISIAAVSIVLLRRPGAKAAKRPKLQAKKKSASVPSGSDSRQGR
jgi:hypothetical protein